MKCETLLTERNNFQVKMKVGFPMRSEEGMQGS